MLHRQSGSKSNRSGPRWGWTLLHTAASHFAYPVSLCACVTRRREGGRVKSFQRQQTCVTARLELRPQCQIERKRSRHWARRCWSVSFISAHSRFLFNVYLSLLHRVTSGWQPHGDITVCLLPMRGVYHHHHHHHQEQTRTFLKNFYGAHRVGLLSRGGIFGICPFPVR